MLPVLLCFAAWGVSLAHAAEVNFRYAHHHCSGAIIWGQVYFCHGESEYLFVSNERRYHIQAESFHVLRPYECVASYHASWFGFGYDFIHSPMERGPFSPGGPSFFDWQSVHVPLWFLIVLFGVLSLFAWRKTPLAGRAFPVEVGAQR